MTTFDEREKSFENKKAHDDEIDFKVEARASKLFGLWIAGKLGLSGQDAQNYAQDVVAKNLEIPGYEDVLGKVRADLKAKKVDISDHLLQVELDKTVLEARRQIMSEGA